MTDQTENETSLKIELYRHQAELVNSNFKLTALVGGLGSGKSYSAVMRFIKLGCLRNGNAKVILTEPTYPMLRDIMRPTIEKIFDSLNIYYTYIKSEYVYTTPFGLLIMRSVDNAKRLKGINATDFISDELDSLPFDHAKEVFFELLARIRECPNATGNFTGTPEGLNFLYWLFADPDNNVDRSNQKLIKAKTTDNLSLPQDYIDTLYNNYDSTLIDQYVNAEFVNLLNRPAYYNFNEDCIINAVPQYNTLEHNLFFTFDFNVDPMTCLCGIYDFYNKKIYIIDELYIRNSNTEKTSEQMAMRHRGKSSTVIIHGDPAGKSRSTKSSETDYSIIRNECMKYFQSVNIRVPDAAPAVKDRLNSVNIAIFNKKLYIHNSCKHLIRDLRRVTLKGDGSIDKSNSELTHISDALGYAVHSIMPVSRPVQSFSKYLEFQGAK